MSEMRESVLLRVAYAPKDGSWWINDESNFVDMSYEF